MKWISSPFAPKAPYAWELSPDRHPSHIAILHVAARSQRCEWEEFQQ